MIETHPFPQILPPHATALMMGTMPPPPDKWCMAFHYPNFYNDMWRIYGAVFFDDENYFRVGQEKRFDADKIRAFLWQKGIGECPTVREVIREKNNASDEHLTVVSRVDLGEVLPKVPAVKWLFTTGGKASEVLLSVVNDELARQNPNHKTLKVPKTNACIHFTVFGRELSLYRLPSSSRAYPLSLAKKIDAYRRFFELAGLI